MKRTIALALVLSVCGAAVATAQDVAAGDGVHSIGSPSREADVRWS
jgi:hypothetical protein